MAYVLMQADKMVETEWDFDPDKGNDWDYCNEHATFSHREACEFILHVPSEQDYFDGEVCNMREAGVSLELIEAFTNARTLKATRLLLFS